MSVRTPRCFQELLGNQGLGADLLRRDNSSIGNDQNRPGEQVSDENDEITNLCLMGAVYGWPLRLRILKRKQLFYGE